MPDPMTGGCQCGHVRYEADIPDGATSICHCRMCQRQTGGPFAVWIAVPLDGLRWTAAEPARYRSSPIAERAFCPRCGTPISFRFLKNAADEELALGSFDDPYRLQPTREYVIERRHPFWAGVGDLPGLTGAQNPNVADRWKDACGKLPD